jgi:ketosteroid isomerase-like protein
MDSVLFDAAFVTCDVAKTSSFFTDDVEFYHDKTGLEKGQQVRDSFKRLTSSCPRGRGIRRELVSGTLRVYPIKDYGAVQMGEHRFVEGGAPTHTVARFVHLWQKKDGVWRISRVLSFDHLPTRDESGSRPSPSTP